MINGTLDLEKLAERMAEVPDEFKFAGTVVHPEKADEPDSDAAVA